MKIKAVFAAALSAVILTGCAAVFDELDDGTYEEGTLTDETTSAVTDEKTSLSYGKGLEEITITAKEDPDPDRKIQRNGLRCGRCAVLTSTEILFQTTSIFTAVCFPERTNKHTTRYMRRCITADRLST